MKKFIIYLKDGPPITITAESDPWWNYDVNLREVTLDFSGSAKFRESAIIGYSEVKQ